MNKLTIDDLKARTKPNRCPGSNPNTYSEWDSYGCHICGARYHCSSCGGGTGMYAHWIKIEGFEGMWCDLCP